MDVGLSTDHPTYAISDRTHPTGDRIKKAAMYPLSNQVSLRSMIEGRSKR
ncbi:MAG: hypothetical protein DSM106950_06755 [Stigonema ocellatum SAG 48.90 = DSM 106950]|nr:hypothetical protein [Stigonema ocellatum SAG 48.90 = DSM 106950]